MYSKRYNRPIAVTAHARRRMAERAVTDALLIDLVETGEARNKDATRLWIAKNYPERSDNLLCVAVVLESAVVVKTVMHHFTWELEP